MFEGERRPLARVADKPINAPAVPRGLCRIEPDLASSLTDGGRPSIGRTSDAGTAAEQLLNCETTGSGRGNK